MKNIKHLLKEYETRAERAATGKEHLIKDSLELEEDIAMTEDDVIKKPDMVKKLSDDGVDINLKDKNAMTEKKQLAQKKKLNESIQEVFNFIQDIYSSNKVAIDENGKALTQGDLAWIITYTLLGVSTFLAQNQIIGLFKKAPGKLKQLIKAFKIVKSGQNVKQKLGEMGINTDKQTPPQIQEAKKAFKVKLIKESKIKALTVLIEKRTGKKISFIVKNKEIEINKKKK